MMQKQCVIERKDWLDDVTIALWPHRLVERLKNALKIEIPEGYQDEAGFHFGPQPTNKQSL